MICNSLIGKKVPWNADNNTIFNGGIKEYNNVIVGPNGIILNENGEYIPGASLQFEIWSIIFGLPNKWKEISDSYINELKLGNVSNISGKFIYALHYFNIYAFGHIWDTIQTLQPICEGNLYTDHKLLCIRPTDHVKNMDFHFSAFGFPEERRKHIDPNKFFRLEKLVVPELPTSPAMISTVGFRWLVNSYLSKIKLYKPDCDIVYASRGYAKDSTLNTRIAINEDAVREYCDKNNVKVITGDTPFEDSVSHFFHAKLIFGIHGSVFKHCIFNNQSARVVEFMTKKSPDGSFKQNCSFVIKDYRIITLESDANCDAVLPIDIIDEHIKEVRRVCCENYSM